MKLRYLEGTERGAEGISDTYAEIENEYSLEN